MHEIKIKVDFENKEIHDIECDYDNRFEIAKVLMNIATGIFNKMIMKDDKIIKPKIKIVGGKNGGNNSTRCV